MGGARRPELELADALPDGLIKIDSHGQIEWINCKASHVFSLQAGEPSSPLMLEQVLRRGDMVITLGQLREQAIEWLSPQDQKTALSLQLFANEGGGELLLARDISQRYHLERMRQDLVANVSHELRTPLTVIHGYLEILHDWKTPKEPPREIVKQLYQQSSRMERLVSDLLLLSRLEASPLALGQSVRVDLASLLPAIIEEAKALSGKRGHKIVLELIPESENVHVVQGSSTELRSAISNLVFNAVNYTQDKGEVRVVCRSADHCQVILEIIDTGIGIDPEHIPRLTERFYRVDKGRSRDTGGTGLGLAIVKHVLIRHQARLEVESLVGIGSTFRIIFEQDH